MDHVVQNEEKKREKEAGEENKTKHKLQLSERAFST